eukprot:COSAG06_NODE_2669_length_6468_cov_28.056367_3_plen_244_part_00
MHQSLLASPDEAMRQAEPSASEIRALSAALERTVMAGGAVPGGLQARRTSDAGWIPGDSRSGPPTPVRGSLHGSIHPIVSALFVVSCLANGGLFLWSNLSVGAEVWTTLCLTAECPTPTRAKVFEFTLRSSVESMWEADAYYVAVLIVSGSAVWPYIKMVAMLLAWFWRVEEGSAGEARRGLVARVLDLAGKFSLIDGFVMILLSVGFGFRIGPILPPLLMLTVDVSQQSALPSPALTRPDLI